MPRGYFLAGERGQYRIAHIAEFGIAPEHEVDESYLDLLKEISLSYNNKDDS